MVLLKELEEYLSKYGVVEKEKPIKAWGIDRRFRFDYHIPSINTIIEVNGGSFSPYSRHTYGDGYERDLMKLNLTTKIGLNIYQFTYPMLKRQEYKLFL